MSNIFNYLSVRSVGAKLVENERMDQAHIAGHLLHSPQLSLLLRVGEFHHQARRSALVHMTIILALSVKPSVMQITIQINTHTHTLRTPTRRLSS